MLEEPIREFYTNDIPTVVSTKNEPKGTHYPNMFLTYQKFSNIFNLPTSRFILTNGCENALRIALLLLKPTSLSIENPTWGLVSIIAKSLNIPIDTLEIIAYYLKVEPYILLKERKNKPLPKRVNMKK